MNRFLEELRKAELKRRVEKLEDESKKKKLDRIFRMQKETPTIEGYDI